MFCGWEKSISLDIAGLIGICLTVVFSAAQLIKTFYGQIKAKLREEFVLKNLSEINTQLNNHITDLGKKVDDMSVNLDKKVDNMSVNLDKKVKEVTDKLDCCRSERSDYRVKTEGRLSSLETKADIEKQ
jgi:transcriptional regulator of heat shock response